ncbi:uncharacterized protein LOC131822600 [Mustela lutreola]|uniref:uncharacterized protein LOC131822600 n=1 Tax=Mustela lutreola TaxID=9666 RepID=UPI0027976649|nr:uncharacterized protein LOC131822600 [Mustela lutreola]
MAEAVPEVGERTPAGESPAPLAPPWPSRDRGDRTPPPAPPPPRRSEPSPAPPPPHSETERTREPRADCGSPRSLSGPARSATAPTTHERSKKNSPVSADTDEDE